MSSRVSLACVFVVCITLFAQAPPLVPGPNVYMVMTSPSASGDLTTKLDPPVKACQGLQSCNDTKLQWQNEPSCDKSPRDPRTIFCGSNDARLVGPDAGTGGGTEVDATGAVACG